MKTKKKVLVVALAVALLAIAVGGSLAWFTDTDEVKNVFTVGSVDIVQKETDADGKDFTQNQALLPIVNTAAPAEDENYIGKVVTVENTGKNDAYVRTFIAVPAVLKDILRLDTTIGKWVQDTNAWANVTVDGMGYTVISFTYTDKLEPGQKTEAVLKGVYLDASVDVKENASGVKQFCTENTDGTYKFYDYDITGTVNVLVATQGVQADGFVDGAVDALDIAFGTTPDFVIE